ncbi:MAG: asnB [Acidobacteria bacterium]|nr:asnB [Acidobacteriota bacterium]
MCGIAGVVRRDGAIAPDPSAALGAALAHRGPDGGGVWRAPAGDVLLVHRRLAIIDPGPSGAQPMATADGRHHIAYNGEVFNYRDLRRSLEARGEHFTTASDTEVLLRLLSRDGPSALARVRGMFALAWWDAATRALVVARDRFGIKPLYVATTDRSIAFASEIHALVSSGLVARTIDPAGVLGFLSWGTVPPTLTYVAGIESLASGTWLRWSQDGTREQASFADLADVYARPHSGCRAPELRARTGAAVQASVAAHLIADVPVGVFLSGGIDSSAILSAATAAGVSGLNTYTVRFDDRSSEHDYAKLVATTFGATHHELVLDASRIVADLPAILARLDQPTLDAVNAYYVSSAVAETGIKAVLSGSGGDEMFGGYPSFRRLPAAMRWKRRLQPIAAAMTPVASAALPKRLTQRWQHFMSGNGRMAAAYRTQRGLYMPAELEQVAGPALRDRWTAAKARVAAAEAVLFDGDASSLEGDVARLETRVYLGSQLLRDLDVMSMAHGLEVRVPFVDHVLLDAVWPDLGAHPALMRNKRLLHETLTRPLPRPAVDRPKQTFTLPFAKWMAADLQPFIRAGMASLVEGGWIASSVPDATWLAWQRGAAHWSRPWALGVLGAFLRQA